MFSGGHHNVRVVKIETTEVGSHVQWWAPQRQGRQDCDHRGREPCSMVGTTPSEALNLKQQRYGAHIPSPYRRQVLKKNGDLIASKVMKVFY
jgi:hypothetical protein